MSRFGLNVAFNRVLEASLQRSTVTTQGNMKKAPRAVEQWHWRITNYLDRLYPLQALRLRTRRPTALRDSTNDPVPWTPPAQSDLLYSLRSLLNALWHADHTHTPRPQAMSDAGFHFIPRRAPSRMPFGGTGVFLHPAVPDTPEPRFLPANRLISIYPGTIYTPTDPILVASINNAYILRRYDGHLIDGRPHGLSKWIYEGLVKRYWWPGTRWPPCDPGHWLLPVRDDEPALHNPYAIGQYINHGTRAAPANVAYVELDVPLDTLPLHLHQYLPNAPYRARAGYPRLAGSKYDPDAVPPVCGGDGVVLPMVVLVTTREVQVGDELLSTYHEMVSVGRG